MYHIDNLNSWLVVALIALFTLKVPPRWVARVKANAFTPATHLHSRAGTHFSFWSAAINILGVSELAKDTGYPLCTYILNQNIPKMIGDIIREVEYTVQQWCPNKNPNGPHSIGSKNSSIQNVLKILRPKGPVGPASPVMDNTAVQCTICIY